MNDSQMRGLKHLETELLEEQGRRSGKDCWTRALCAPMWLLKDVGFAEATSTSRLGIISNLCVSVCGWVSSAIVIIGNWSVDSNRIPINGAFWNSDPFSSLNYPSRLFLICLWTSSVNMIFVCCKEAIINLTSALIPCMLFCWCNVENVQLHLYPSIIHNWIVSWSHEWLEWFFGMLVSILRNILIYL